ncbi:MAG TPA: hypothetical protein VH877_10055 [Polyangia bacterium]|nr:hypothetical protein [Polyangia bacterium]
MTLLKMGPGELVADRFMMELLTGHAGRSFGFRARDGLTGKPVALLVHEVGQAEGVARQAAELMRQMGPIGRPCVAASLVRSLLDQGRIEEARATAEEGLAELAALGGRCLMDLKLLLPGRTHAKPQAIRRGHARRWPRPMRCSGSERSG